MPRLRKIIFNNHVHFITMSVEEAIMLPANPMVTFLLKAALLRASLHHPITISHLLVNGTHIHMIIRVDNPEDIPGFMERFKTESAHYLNRLLGRRKRTVWCSSYDSPRLYNIEDVIKYICYLYTNPVKDGLISTIEQYPGLSSWNVYQNNQKYITARTISRDSVFELRQEQDFSAYKKAMLRVKDSKYTGKLKVLPINPNDWLKAYNITSAAEIAEINEKVISLIREKELAVQSERLSENKPFVGRHALENQGIDLGYRPERAGRKLWCLCAHKAQRKAYISFLKSIAERAAEVYRSWRLGATSERMPAGVFAPRMPQLFNAIG